MDTVIRAAHPGEYAAVGELLADVYLGDGLLKHGPEDGYLTALRDTGSRAAAAEVLVAADGTGGRLLGTATFVAPGSGYAEIARADEAEFRMLAVVPEARGRGVGEALVRACTERARELGVRRLVLSTQDCMAAARSLYLRLGFTRLPERDWVPVPEVPLLAFALDLAAD